MFASPNIFPSKSKNSNNAIKDKVKEGWSKFFSDESNSF
jgi:hypothetical protein